MRKTTLLSLYLQFAVFIFICLLSTSGQAVVKQQNDLLQFSAAGHVLGFEQNSVYVVNGDHLLTVNFSGTRGVKPVLDRVDGESSLTRVTYSDLWSGIDLVYEAAENGIAESIWTIAAGADPAQIRLRYNMPAVIQDNGNLRVNFKTGWMEESKPVAWQEIDNHRIPVEVAFAKISSVNASPVLGFILGAYDPSYPLSIDPILDWNTFVGTSQYQEGNGIAVDGNGDVYVVGTTQDSWGTPKHAYSGGLDAFVAKFNAAGQLQWHSFIGTADGDYGNDIVIDSLAVYIAGFTGGSGNGDAFAAVMAKDGTYGWYRYIGSAGSSEQGYGIAVDSAANIYLTGNGGDNWNGPGDTPPVVLGTTQDAFVVKWNYLGEYQWHTFLGGVAGVEIGRAIAVDDEGWVYVTGESSGTWGNPLSDHNGGADAFVAKLNSNGIRQWNTFIGSADSEWPSDITVNIGGSLVYVTGKKTATGTQEGFLASLNSAGVLQWYSVVNYTSQDMGRAIVVDDVGDIYLADDFSALKFNAAGAFQWGVQLGGETTGIGVDGNGNVFVGGQSGSSWGTPINPHAGGSDAFAARICTDCYLVSTSVPDEHGAVSPSSVVVSAGDTADFNIAPDAGYSIDSVSGCDGTWTGVNPYVTGAIAYDCTVTASFTRNKIVTPTPGPLSSLLSAGNSEHALALKGDGTVEAWGCNTFGTPATVPEGLGGVTAVSAGEFHSLALKADGTVTAWGNNSSGESTVPVGLSGVIAVEAGSGKSFALKSDGTLVGWGGANAAGLAAEKTDVVAVTSGSYTLVLKGDGTVEYLGAPAPGNEVPVGLVNVVQVAIGYQHVLALKSDGTVVAWGVNTDGETNVPVGLTGVLAVSAGQSYSLALKDDGTVVGWGRNTYGQTAVPGTLTDAVAITAAGTYALALKADGTIVHWGYSNICTELPLSLNLLPFHGEHGVISPAIPQSVVHGSAAQFVAVPETGYAVSVGGTCDGSLDGLTYTTDSVTADCTVDASFSLMHFTISASVDENGTLDADSAEVEYGDAASFTVTPDEGYTTDTVVGGTCSAGSWNGSTYTTGVIIGACSISFTHTPLYTVTAGVDGHGALDKTELIVRQGDTASFTVTPDGGYTTDSAVGGTCPGGSWNGTTYTTGSITGTCSVGFTHSPISYIVSASVDNHGVLNSFEEATDYGTTASFTVTPENGYSTDPQVGGSCPVGSWSGASYTTGIVTGSCSVSFSHTINSYTVSAVVDEYGTLDTDSQIVTHNATASFTVTPDEGYVTNTQVGGTCPAGSWDDNSYTTGSVLATCSVSFTHIEKQPDFIVTPSPGSAGTLLGAAMQVLALKGDGTVTAWGSDSYGQATPPENLAGVKAVSAGYFSSHALLNDGTVVGWGSYSGGGAELPPVGLTDVIAIAGGYSHTLALRKDGTVVAWGLDYSGETSIPTGLTGVIAISAGYHRSVALTSDGEVVAWGDDTYGDSTVPPGLNNVVAIASSLSRHTLVLKDDGTVSGFGLNSVHQLDIPPDLVDVVAVSAGSGHSLALKSDGTVVAWGYNSGGSTSVPPDLTDVVAISAGNSFSLALKSDGTIVGWGMNDYGVLDIPESLNLIPLHGEGGTIFPDRPIGASPGSVLQFTLTSDDGFTPVVDGTCGGTLTGNVFTTNPITADCTVEASFVSGDDGCHFFVLPGLNGKAAVICL